MISRIAYLEWAISTFPLARYNLAVSGVCPVSLETLEEMGAKPLLGAPHAVPAFCHGISQRYGIPETEVLPALGTSGALFVSLAVGARAGDSILVEAPAYEPLYRVAEGLGLTVNRFERSFEEGFKLNISRILGALYPATKMVLLSSPNNPSGVFDTNEELLELSRALKARGVLLVVDEVYRELCDEGTTARTLDTNIIALSSLTKCFGLGFSRSGWLLGPREFIERARMLTMHITGEFPRMSAAVGAAGISVAGPLLEIARSEADERFSLVCSFAERNAKHLIWVPPARGGVFGFFKDKGGRSTKELLLAGLESHQVLAVPGDFFGVPDGFRLSWTLAPEQIQEGLLRLERVLGCE